MKHLQAMTILQRCQAELRDASASIARNHARVSAAVDMVGRARRGLDDTPAILVHMFDRQQLESLTATLRDSRDMIPDTDSPQWKLADEILAPFDAAHSIALR